MPDAGSAKLVGVLRDDTGRAIGRARLLVAAVGGRRTSEEPRSCGKSNAFSLGAGRWAVDTDATGEFCLLVPTAGAGRFALRFEGDRYYDGSESELEVDTSRRSLVLTFWPEPRVLALERQHQTVTVQTRLEPADVEAAAESALIELVLKTPEGVERKLGQLTRTVGDSAVFSVAAKDLGEAGPATLIARFPGSETISRARQTAVVQRTARVTLALAGPLAASDPSDGLVIPIAVGSALGAVPAGTVEAIVGGESVGTAPVSAGAARLIATFDAPHGGSVPVTLRYLPVAPWWIPGEPLTLSAPIAAPSPWRRAPWVVAALMIAIWVVRGWRRPARSEKKAPREQPSLPSGRASVEVIERGPAKSGWRGRVLDAHDGSPVVGARIAILVPAFDGGGRAASAITDQEGRFELPHVAGSDVEGTQIEARARFHTRLSRALPPPGFVSIQLVSRRRALLERLVDWARRAGRPFSDPSEPTPGHVAEVARARRAEDVERWARAVEQAAYGPEPPEERDEERVREREPTWQGGAR